MKAKYHLTRLVTTAVYLGFGLLGVLIGIKTFRQYEVIVHGILGLVIFYLIYRGFLSPRIDKATNDDMLFEFPKIKYFLFIFFWTLIIYWAFREVSTMVLSLL